eukprot:737575-Rhodomonas_salina.1
MFGMNGNAACRNASAAGRHGRNAPTACRGCASTAVLPAEMEAADTKRDTACILERHAPLNENTASINEGIPAINRSTTAINGRTPWP